MTHELLYTSAPRGLRPGSTGYCVVAQTDGIPRALVEQLEALSTYRHLRVGENPGASGNPVAHIHTITNAGGRTYHVLSRIADTGLDHTGRSNYLAHHVALEEGALPRQGPAAACEALDFETAWDGQVGGLPGGRAVPGGSAEPQKCARWEEVTGDAGWGGVLAGATDPGDPAYIVFEPGQDVLPLLAEAMALLAPEERWEITFSTCFTKTSGSACQWRCVPTGSAEAKAAISARRGVVVRLDHNAPRTDPPAGRLVDAARTGVVPQRRARPERAADAPAHRVARYEPPPGYEVTDSEPEPEAEAEAEVAEAPARPARREASRPQPAPPPRRGAGQLILGLLMGLILALVMVALVEIGAKASPLRLGGIESKYEKEWKEKFEKTDAEKKTATELAETTAFKLKDAEGRITGAQGGVITMSDKLKKLEKDVKDTTAGKLKAEGERDGLQAELSRQLPKAGKRIEELQKDLTKAGKDLEKANKELEKLRAAAPPPGARLGQPVSVGVPIELKDLPKDVVRQLFAIPPLDKGDKPTLTILGLPDKLQVVPDKDKEKDKDKVVVKPSKSKTDNFQAEFKIVDGFVTVTGEKLSNFPLLGSAVFCVNLGPGKDTYYHLAGADQRVPNAKMASAGESKYYFTHAPFNWYKTEYDDAITKGQIELGPTARVSINKEEYLLVADPGKENVLVNRPADKMTPTVTLTLEKGTLTVEVTYTKETKPMTPPSGTIVAAELVRLVGVGAEKAPVRLELLRIRLHAPLPAN